jgi:hypothetical protein
MITFNSVAVKILLQGLKEILIARRPISAHNIVVSLSTLDANLNNILTYFLTDVTNPTNIRGLEF